MNGLRLSKIIIVFTFLVVGSITSSCLEDHSPNTNAYLLSNKMKMRSSSQLFSPVNSSLAHSHVESKGLSLKNSTPPSLDEKPSNSNVGSSKQAVCNQTEPLDQIGDVKLVNGTLMQKILHSDSNITSRSQPALCVLVYFFSHHCPFSVQGSGYVNALARALKNIPVYGLDSIEHHSMNARYGVMGTPSLLLFHNGNVIARFNASEYSTSSLISFVHHYTNQNVDFINVTSHDFSEIELPSEIKPSFSLALYVSWIFLVILGAYVFFTSEMYAKLSETFLNNWREAEAQHAHQE